MTDAKHTIRALGPADVDAYMRIRREGLLETPHAFGPTPDEDQCLDRETMLRRLGHAENAVFGAFDSLGSLCAVAGFHRFERAKVRHRALIWGVYTRPESRGQGAGGLLFDAMIVHARTQAGIEILELSVSAGTPDAQRLYERKGFVAWGREPDKIRIGSVSHDEIYLQLRL